MALFEFEDGHLVPAQFGYPVAQDLGPDLVDAICQQVLQIVSRPLFPVTWRDMTGQDDEETPRLTALDVTGQIVSVEILKELDPETLIASLSRLAEVASISRPAPRASVPVGRSSATRCPLPSARAPASLWSRATSTPPCAPPYPCWQPPASRCTS